MENIIDLDKSFRDSLYKSTDKSMNNTTIPHIHHSYNNYISNNNNYTNYNYNNNNNNYNNNNHNNEDSSKKNTFQTKIFNYSKSNHHINNNNTNTNKKNNKQKPSYFESVDDVSSGILTVYKKHNIINNNYYILSGNTLNFAPVSSQIECNNFSKQSSGNLNIFDSEYYIPSSVPFFRALTKTNSEMSFDEGKRLSDSIYSYLKNRDSYNFDWKQSINFNNSESFINDESFENIDYMIKRLGYTQQHNNNFNMQGNNMICYNSNNNIIANSNTQEEFFLRNLNKHKTVQKVSKSLKLISLLFYYYSI